MPPIAAAELASGLLPVVVGVTGHRDLPAEDLYRLEAVVETQLRQIQSKSPSSPHVILSSLAEGADRLAAHIALRLGWVLGVVLPTSAAIYEGDFSSVASRTEFHDLLMQAAWIEQLHFDVTGQTAYAAASLRIARQSLYMLALWDGDSTGAEGGTAATAGMFRHGIPEPELPGPSDNTLPDARPVIHVMARRARNMERILANEVGNIVILPPEPGGIRRDNELERWQRVLRSIDCFNSDAATCMRDFAGEVEATYMSLTEQVSSGQSEMTRSAARLHAVADVMSSKAQRQRNHELYWLFGLTLVAIFCEQIYSGPIWAPGWLAGAIVAGVLAAFVFSRGGRARLEERYLDYRSLAEACRVQYFWKLASLSASVADHYLRDQRDELEWLRQAVRNTELQSKVTPPTLEFHRAVARAWIDDQRHWFIGDGATTSGKAGWNAHQAEIWSRRVAWVFKAGIAVTVILLLLHASIVSRHDNSAEDILQWFVVAYGMLFGTAGMIAVHLQVKSFAEHARGYRRMGLVMAMARHHLDVALAKGDLAAADNVLLGAGRDALEENSSWLLMHRDRPAHVPLG